MIDMKCPVCDKQMKIGMLDPDDSMSTVWMSIMPCECVCSYGASKAVWQELIRTRKALDVAVDALKLISLRYLCEYADKALDQIKQITAIEQKE